MWGRLCVLCWGAKKLNLEARKWVVHVTAEEKSTGELAVAGQASDDRGWT